jgi:hypothetical protein
MLAGSVSSRNVPKPALSEETVPEAASKQTMVKMPA